MRRSGSLFLLLLLICAWPAFPEPSYSRWRVGNPQDTAAAPHGGLALLGGGRDVNQAFEWMISQGGGGDFLILRASGDDAYNAYVHQFGGAASVTTILCRDRQAASDPAVLRAIRQAEVIFLAGGDQWNYVRLWQGTPLVDAIAAAARRGACVGGTSAGAAVLGQFAFSAENDTVTSGEALRNPLDRRVTLVRGFLDLHPLRDTITDSHFTSHNRMGRLLAFMADVLRNGWSLDVRGLGIDDRTAVLVDASGLARVRGSGDAFFLRMRRVGRCRAKKPLAVDDVPVYRLQAGLGSFDLPSWSGRGGESYKVYAADGEIGHE